MMTALIAGAHRFLFDIGGFTAASCAVSTLVEGVLGSLVHKKYKAGEMDSVDLFFLTAEAEILQMVIILMISKPLGAAMELVGKIAVPMIVLYEGTIIVVKVTNRGSRENDEKGGET